MPKLIPGRIVWAEASDPRGHNAKCRPWVVVSVTKPDSPDGRLAVIAVTTRVADTLPDVAVPLPWHADRHPQTGLKERCVADTSWVVILPVSAVEYMAGVVPFAEMNRIMALVLGAVSPPPPG